MQENDDLLLDKAKQFEELIDKLENKQFVFSKKQLENYHAKIESDMDEKMVIFEDSLIKENVSKEHYYTKLLAFLKG